MNRFFKQVLLFVGLIHIGLSAGNNESTVASLRAQGLVVQGAQQFSFDTLVPKDISLCDWLAQDKKDATRAYIILQTMLAFLQIILIEPDEEMLQDTMVKAVYDNQDNIFEIIAELWRYNVHLQGYWKHIENVFQRALLLDMKQNLSELEVQALIESERQVLYEFLHVTVNPLAVQQIDGEYFSYLERFLAPFGSMS